MGGKGFGIMAPEDGLKVDELLKIIAWIRTNGRKDSTGNVILTGNEDLNEQ